MATVDRNILFFVPTLSVVGGIERWLQTILSNSENKNIEVLHAYDSPQEITLDNYGKKPVSLHEVYTDNPFLKIMKLMYRARSLNKYCNDKNIHTIIVSADGLIIATLLLKYFKRKDLKIIPVIHQEIKTLNFISRVLLTWLLPIADKVVVVSQGIEAELQEYVSSKKLVLIYNAINLAEIEKKAKEFDISWLPHYKHLVAIGRLESIKRYDHAIRALETIPKLNTNLHILGSGGELCALQTLVQRNSLTEEVIFEGVIANVFPYIAAADALIVTSDFESFGVVIIEAMALGKPVIAYDCNFGPREILQSNINLQETYIITPYGYLVKNGDLGALSSVVKRFTTNTDTFNPEVIRKRAAEFDIGKTIEHWKQLLI